MVRAVFFVAVCAVAAQSAFGWDLNVPGLFGSSGSIGTLAPSRGAGVGLNMENGALNSKIELGPLGGIQSRIVAPVLPSITEIAENVHNEFQKMTNQVGSFFSGIIDAGLGMVGLPKLDLWEKIISAQTFLIDGVKTNVMGVIKLAGGLLEAAYHGGLVTAKEASAAASAFMKSALESVVNPLAMVIDAVQWAIDSKLILEKKAVELVAQAIKQGLHTVEGASDTAANAFLDAAVGAQTITKEVADKLKEFIRNQADKSASGSANANAEAGNKAETENKAEANLEAGANARAEAGAANAEAAKAELAAEASITPPAPAAAAEITASA